MTGDEEELLTVLVGALELHVDSCSLENATQALTTSTGAWLEDIIMLWDFYYSYAVGHFAVSQRNLQKWIMYGKKYYHSYSKMDYVR